MFLALKRADMTRLGACLGAGHRIFLLALPILAVELALRRAFPSTHALIDDYANHAHFVLLMLLGWLVAASPALADAATRCWRPLVATAGALILLWIVLRATGTVLPFEARQAIRALAEWSAIAGLLGWGAQHLGRPIPFLTSFSGLSFPFYIFHQMAIVLLGYALLAWSDAPLAKFLAIAALSFAASLALSHAARLTRLTRLLFGMR